MKFHPGYLALAPLAPLGAAVARAVLMPKKKSAYQPQPDADRAMAYAEKLAAMIRCDTTSYANVYEPERFERFHAQLAQLFPLVHEKLEHTVIDGNLLFCWKGKAQNARLCNNDKSAIYLPRQNPYFYLKWLKIKAFGE